MVLACSAEFHYCKKTNVKETVEHVLKELRDRGLKPYYIYGDSTGKGNEQTPLLAYVKVYEDIKGQFDYIFLATGNGMTQGGSLQARQYTEELKKSLVFRLQEIPYRKQLF